VQLTVDTAPGSWRGHVGLVTSVLPSDLDPTATLALVCGPEVMMRLTADVLVERGLPAERVRLSLERNMHCGVGACGHCMLREIVLCLDGPVLDYRRLAPLMTTRGL
jgi:anaerobic sulfite reductase subunit B